MRVGKLVVAGLLAVLTTGCASYVATSGRVVITDEKAAAGVSFSNSDRQLIRDYYRGHRSGQKKRVASGLVKYDKLPAGIQGRALSSALESRLTALPTGYIRLTVGTDVVLLNRDTRVVQDIIYDVVS